MPFKWSEAVGDIDNQEPVTQKYRNAPTIFLADENSTRLIPILLSNENEAGYVLGLRS